MKRDEEAATMQELNTDELIRYSRHFNLKQVGLDGQRKLKNGSVLLIGAGGLGSPLALYLAAAGVGRIGMVDFDVVDETNLQRQILHGQSAVGAPKLQSAKARLADVNPHIDLEMHETRLTADNALEIISQYDVVADGADNFPTRYLVNDACVLAGKPLVSGSILGFEGQLSVYNYKGGPCYRCLFPEPPPPGSVPSCAEGGVLGVLPGVVGCMQANEVLKILMEIGDVAAGRLVLYDALGLSFNQLKIKRDAKCALCGDHPTVTELIDYQVFCGVDPNTPVEPVAEITVQELAANRDAYVLLDVREDYERLISAITPSLHVPLKQLADADLSAAQGKDLLIYCRSGVRSADAARALAGGPFRSITSLQGGVNAWAASVDEALAVY